MTDNLIRIAIVIIGYVVSLISSGRIVKYFIGAYEDNDAQSIKPKEKIYRFDVGAIIGKCENIITITFIMAEQYTGLALIFTAKSLVRKDDIKDNARYYLGGTLVNFTFSVIMGFIIKSLLLYFKSQSGL